MNIIEKLHINGYFIGKLQNDEKLIKLNDLMLEIRNGNLKEKFDFQEKYKFSKDLKPNVVDYDSVFFDILFHNDIPFKINEATGLDLVLTHIQLRVSYPTKGLKSSYMSWHRDTHYYRNKNIIGNIPPVYKLIYYPCFDKPSTKQLQVIDNSHHFIFKNKLLDLIYPRISKKTNILSDNINYLFFNTELHHNVVNTKDNNGSIRLIYSFARKQQIKSFEDNKILKTYLERMNK